MKYLQKLNSIPVIFKSITNKILLNQNVTDEENEKTFFALIGVKVLQYNSGTD